jgi:hypothetical protein
MAPFRNKGWVHFEKMSEIFPNATPRGSYAFSPMMNATTPSQLRVTDDETGVQAAAETSTTSGHDEIADGDGTTLISTVASKFRKIPSTTLNNDDIITINSGSPPPPSVDAISNNPSTNLGSNSTSDVVHLAKGSLARKTPAELPSPGHAVAGPSRRTKASSRGRSSKNARTTNNEASASIIVHNMQGSINALTATVRDSVAVDPITKVRQEAVRLLQKEEGLSPKQQVALFQMFADKHALPQIYLAIESAPLRLLFLEDLLKDVKGDD